LTSQWIFTPGSKPISEVNGITNLADAVRSWRALDGTLRDRAVLTIEHPLLLNGISTSRFSGATLAELAAHLPKQG
jgi:hypothetical protein